MHTPLPFRSSLPAKFAPRVAAAATTTHGLGEPLQVCAGPTEPHSAAARAPPPPAARLSLRVPPGSSFRPARRRVTSTRHRSLARRPGVAARKARGGSKDGGRKGPEEEAEAAGFGPSFSPLATSLSLWGIQHVVQCGTARSPAHVLHWKIYLAIEKALPVACGPLSSNLSNASTEHPRPASGSASDLPYYPPLPPGKQCS